MPPLLFILWTHNRVESKDALGRTKTPHLQIASTEVFLFAVFQQSLVICNLPTPFFLFQGLLIFSLFFLLFFIHHLSPAQELGHQAKKSVQLGSSDSSFNHCHFHNNPCSNCSQQKQKQDEGFSSLLLWSPHRRGSLLSDSRRKFLTSFQLSALNLDVEP